MKLYEIKNEIESISNWLDPETGEFMDGGLEYLDSIEIERKEKILSIAKKIDVMKAEEEAIKNKVKILSQRARAVSNAADRLKTYIANAMREGEKLKDEEIQISWRKSESVDVFGDPANLPAEFLKFKIDVDKTSLKKALKDGLACNDAKLIEKNNLIIK